MSRRDWKNVHPSSLIDALRLCKDHARERRNLSVERIADLMGVTHHDLYKWLSNGRMPAMLIPAYEHACGYHFVTRWLAASAGHLVIRIPTGRNGTADDVHQLQAVLHTAVGHLLHFYAGQAEAPATLSAIQAGMEGLAWHRGNVADYDAPQLDLEAV